MEASPLFQLLRSLSEIEAAMNQPLKKSETEWAQLHLRLDEVCAQFQTLQTKTGRVAALQVQEAKGQMQSLYSRLEQRKLDRDISHLKEEMSHCEHPSSAGGLKKSVERLRKCVASITQKHALTGDHLRLLADAKAFLNPPPRLEEKRMLPMPVAPSPENGEMAIELMEIAEMVFNGRWLEGKKALDQLPESIKRWIESHRQITSRHGRVGKVEAAAAIVATSFELSCGRPIYYSAHELAELFSFKPEER